MKSGDVYLTVTGRCRADIEDEVDYALVTLYGERVLYEAFLTDFEVIQDFFSKYLGQPPKVRCTYLVDVME